jgi:DNA-nicking Smr family endonuclease
MSSGRRLSDEERALWSGLARSVTPLRRAKKSGKATAAPAAADEKPSPSPTKRRAPVPVVPAAKTPPLAPLGRRLKQRVARGREPIDARIDLHGMTQSEAHAALFTFLQRASLDGVRIALVVTGKGGGRRARDRSRDLGHDPDIARGVLKRQVPHWLSLPQFRALIVGFEDAHIGHGGEGALYVRLRRQR